VWRGVDLIVRFSVPAFVLLAGMVLAYRYGEQRLGREFLLKRARRTLVPFLVWAPLFCVFDLVVSGEIPMSARAVADWFANGAGHLYFLILVPQLYLLMLLWPAGRRRTAMVAAAAVAVMLALDTVRLYVPMSSGAARQATLMHGFEEFPFWVGYFAVGVLVGRMLAARHGRGVRGWPFAAAIAPLALAMLWVDVHGAVNGRGWADGTGAFLRPLLFPMALAVCGSAVFGVPALLRRMPRLDRATTLVSRHSLGIYIVHPMLLWVFGSMLRRWLHAHLPVSIVAVAALTVATAASALLVAMLLSRTPLAPAIGERRVRTAAPQGQERELLGRRAA
jgi:surface polysaccharide O-acyltransferase-like enzyme